MTDVDKVNFLDFEKKFSDDYQFKMLRSEPTHKTTSTKGTSQSGPGCDNQVEKIDKDVFKCILEKEHLFNTPTFWAK
jgi:hypothetical protein